MTEILPSGSLIALYEFDIFRKISPSAQHKIAHNPLTSRFHPFKILNNVNIRRTVNERHLNP